MIESKVSVEKKSLSDEEVYDQDDDDYDSSNPKKKQVSLLPYYSAYSPNHILYLTFILI
jgi:hypothetical protein